MFRLPTRPEMLIRPEASDDVAAISRLTEAAFRGHSHSDGSEPRIIGRLRAAGALSCSIVAVDEGEVIGHAAASPITIGAADEGWFGLGPVSVTPGRQGRGVGVALVDAVLNRLRAVDARGCVVLGEPSYYERFGFRPWAQLILPGVPASHFLALSFDGPIPSGKVAYHQAFSEAG